MKEATTPSTKGSRLGRSAAVAAWKASRARIVGLKPDLQGKRIRHDVPTCLVFLFLRCSWALRYPKPPRAVRHRQHDDLPLTLRREIAHRRGVRGRGQIVVPQLFAGAQV